MPLQGASDGRRVKANGKENDMYTVPVVLAIVIVFLAVLIFWGAYSEERRGSAR